LVTSNFDRAAFLQTAKAVALKCREVHETIIAGLAADETVA